MTRLIVLSVAVLLAACGTGGSQRSSSGSGTASENETANLNMQLAMGYMEQGNLEVALQKITRALEADPRSSDAHTVAAVLNERIGEVEKAEGHYRSAVRYSPRDGGVLNNYGTFLCKTGELESAEQHFLRAIESPFYQTPEVALTNAGNCVSKVPNVDRARQYYRRALDFNPRYADALFQLAKLQLADRQCLGARGLIQRFEAVATHTTDSLDVAADIEECNGDKEAAENYREALQKLSRSGW